MAETAGTIKGNLKIEVDELGLEAKITFTRDEGGAEWNQQKILALLERKEIISGVDRYEIETFAGIVAKRDEPYTFIVARGIAPEPGTSARFSIEEAGLPAELREAASKFPDPPTPPAVFEHIVEKIKVEEFVQQKPKLPFLKAKEKKEIRWEKKTTVVAVEVDPHEQGRGYIKSGGTVAKVTPAEMPKNGKDIFGKEIAAAAAPEAARAAFYLGKDLKDAGQEIKAEVSGFFRYGENWIELFPFTESSFVLSKSEDGLNCLFSFTPGSDQADLPKAEIIFKEGEQLGFDPEDLISAAELDELIARAAAENVRIENRTISQGDDAQIHITVAEDKMKALLSLKKGCGNGNKLSLKEISTRIREAALSGMDIGKVKQAILDFYHGEKLELLDYPLIEGRLPKAGEDATIEWQVHFVEPSETAELKKKANDRADQLKGFKSIQEFTIESVTEMVRVKDRAKVAMIGPAKDGAAGVDVYGTALPGKKGKELKIKLFENLQQMKTEIVAMCDGVLEKAEQDGTILLRARSHADHRLRVDLFEDRMQGFLTLIPPEGTGTPLNPDEVYREIEDQGIIKGIKQEVLADAILEAKGGKAVTDLVFAEGQPPTHAGDRALIMRINQAKGTSVSVGQDGRADYKNQDKITTIEKDSLIAELPPPAVAEDGWDVTGKPIAARESQAQAVQLGKNVERREEPDGSVKFYSLVSGVIFHERGLLDVLSLHSVEGDVGLTTGNIMFSGSVHIKGSVQSGFKVISGRRIIVDENVQAALLSADESIIIQKGIVGSGKAILRAKKEITAHFAEQALLLAVGDIHLTNASLRNQIKCNGKLYLESDKGSIIGGVVKARKGVVAVNLGSERGTPTEISFGQDYLIADRIDLEVKEVEKIKARNQELDASMRRLERSSVTNSDELARLRQGKLHNMKVMEKRNHRIFALRERFEEHFPSEIVVKGNAFPGVVLKSHGRIHELKDKTSETRFIFNPETGKIEAQPLQ